MWIEIFGSAIIGSLGGLSLPLRECGLKYFYLSSLACCHAVTPLAGVWIEIYYIINLGIAHDVTPLAGVWIEIADILQAYCYSNFP